MDDCCFYCERPFETEDDREEWHCYGCSTLICPDCDLSDPPLGMHHPEDHRDPTDYEGEE